MSWMRDAPSSREKVIMGEPPGRHQLLMVRGEDILFSLSLDEGDTALIGRSPAAQVVLRDAEVSWMHAMVWAERGWLWVRDISSTNGTLLDGRRLKEAALVEKECLLQVGSTLLVLRPAASSLPRAVPQRLWMEDLSSGLRFPVTAAPHAFTGGAVSIACHPDGRVILSSGASPTEAEAVVGVGETFAVGGRRYRLLDDQLADPQPTDFTREQGFPYSLQEGGPGTLVLADLSSGQQHTFSSARRAEILRLLGERLLLDRAQKRAPSQQGWCDDDTLGTHIWGRGWVEGSNRLNVIVHRIRRELETGGFDHTCLEKRRGGLRLWVQRILLTGTPPRPGAGHGVGGDYDQG